MCGIGNCQEEKSVRLRTPREHCGALKTRVLKAPQCSRGVRSLTDFSSWQLPIRHIAYVKVAVRFCTRPLTSPWAVRTPRMALFRPK